MERAKNYSYWSHCNGAVPAVFPSNYFDFSCRSARIGEQPGVASTVMAAGHERWGKQ